MTVYRLELRSTADWNDLRYREYTRSRSRAEAFQLIPKIKFTDSGHGIVPHVKEHTGRREPTNKLLADYVEESISAAAPKIKLTGMRAVEDWKHSQCALGWDGYSIYGDRASIEAVRTALHDAGTVPELRERIRQLIADVELWKSRWEAERADHETTMKQFDREPAP